MDNPKEIFIEVGLRFNEANELDFFGIDDVNSALQFGYALASMQKGRALMDKVGEDSQNVRMKFTGFSVVAVLQLPKTAGQAT
ncbi:MAG: hypothetical protein ACK49R_03885 [Planctomycetota bacterium]|jgi:hypothetical protein